MTSRLRRVASALAEQRKPVRFVIARVLSKTGLCRYFRIRCNGYTLRFFPTAMSSALWVDVEYRSDDTEFFQSYIREGDVVIDGGANIGFLTLLASRLTGNAGRVYAVEAHPSTAHFLAENARLNKVSNVEIVQAALGSEPGEVMFTNSPLDDQNYVGNDGVGVRVRVATLDEMFAENLPRVDLLKLDLEGYELDALVGGRKLLNAATCIYLESWDAHCERYGRKASDVISFLRTSGYSVLKANRKVLQRVEESHTSPVCENLIAVRNEMDLMSRLQDHGYRFGDPDTAKL